MLAGYNSRIMKKPFLGNLSPREFLREYWQKKPLLVRSAFPGFSGLLSPQELAGLACLEEAQSRLVLHKGDRWLLRDGPFADDDFARLPKTKWTLLVQGVNHFLPEAEHLLRKFDFVPHARLDDLMVSYAPKGGSVGPHFDSYDVFLLQGLGQRHWQISAQQDMTLVPDAPLKILQHFQPEQEWTLGPGDMLYLPPRYAHFGVAEGDCMTYSVGFRAPSAQELATQFLAYLQDKIQVDGMYQDPDLAPPKHPAEIGGKMLTQVSRMLAQIRWDRTDVAGFLGQYLSEPKPHVFYEPPKRPLPPKDFTQRCRKQGLKLALTSSMLFHGDTFFINGEICETGAGAHEILRRLADRRCLPPDTQIGPEAEQYLYQWYLLGYLAPGT